MKKNNFFSLYLLRVLIHKKNVILSQTNFIVKVLPNFYASINVEPYIFLQREQIFSQQ